MVIVKIEVAQEDIDLIKSELKQSEDIELNPLFITLASYDQMVCLQRDFAYNLIALYEMNKDKNIPTYLEVIDQD